MDIRCSGEEMAKLRTLFVEEMAKIRLDINSSRIQQGKKKSYQVVFPFCISNIKLKCMVINTIIMDLHRSIIRKKVLLSNLALKYMFDKANKFTSSFQ